MNVEEDVTAIEREYLIGGKGIEIGGSNPRTKNNPSDATRYPLNYQTISLVDDNPMLSSLAYRLTLWSNFFSLVGAGARAGVIVIDGVGVGVGFGFGFGVGVGVGVGVGFGFGFGFVRSIANSNLDMGHE